MYVIDPEGSTMSSGLIKWVWPGAISFLAHIGLLASPGLLSTGWSGARDVIKAEVIDIADSNSPKKNSNQNGEKHETHELSNEEMVERLNLPMGVPRNLKCSVAVAVAGDGRVLDAVVTQSTGNPRFDQSILNAIYKASPFPKPAADQLKAGMYRFELHLGGR